MRSGRVMVRRRLAGMARQAALAAIVLLAASCTAIYRNHGYVPPDADLAQITVGRDTRDSVANLIGRPSAQGLLNDQGWYYVQSLFRTRGPAAPQEIDREVVAISFDDKGVVRNVERFGLDRGRVITLSRRVTESNIRGRSVLTQIFSNFGRLDPKEFIR